jgi:hypothetical protein
VKITLHYFTAFIIQQKRKTVNHFFAFSGTFQDFRDISQISHIKMHKFSSRDRAPDAGILRIREKSSKIKETALHSARFVV